MKITYKIRKAVCIFTAGILILFAETSFTGCSKNSSDTGIVSSEKEIMRTLSYTVSSIEPDEDSIYSVTTKSDRMYMAVNDFEQHGDVAYSKCYIAVMDKSGKTQLKIPVYEQTEDNQFGTLYNSFIVDDNGNITCLLLSGTADPQTYKREESYQLLTFDADGNLTSSADIAPILTNKDKEQGRYIYDFIMDNEGNIYCNLYTCVRVLDKTGNALFTTDDIDNGYVKSLILANSGVPTACINQWGEKPICKFAEIDMGTKNFGVEQILPEFNGSVYPGSGDYLCYIPNDTGIAGYRADTLEKETVLNLLNLGVDTTNLTAFISFDDGSFIVGIQTNNGTALPNMSYYNIKPVDSQNIKDKQIITLGCFSMDMFWRSEIAYFNRTNDDYIISAVSYADNNDTFDYDAAITKFNNELIAGNIPDIILLYNQRIFDSHTKKGLFTDLYSLIDNDPDLSRDSFLPNILAALETDGKLCKMAVGFNVTTYAAKTSLVGSAKSLTFYEANKLVLGLPEGAELTNDGDTQMNFLRMALRYNNFTDYENGTCNFDSPEFKEILETAKTYPAEIDYRSIDYIEREFAVQNDKALLYSAYPSDFDTFSRIKKGIIGEDITFVGFPNNDGANGSLNIDTIIAISEKSQLKEGAWEFIKSALNDIVIEEEYEIFNPYAKANTESITEKRWCMNRLYNMGMGFPVLVSDLEHLGTQAVIPLKTFNENGEIVPQENIYSVNGVEIRTETPTPEEVQEFIAYLSSVENFYKYDRNVDRIVEEEASSFFAGVKSVDETAQLIQSRVSVYMNEQYR